ncbi:MAG: hypothetical protein Q4B06_01560 [Candidatus Saccharibacteria bacterium]|nr:hypothetical protein [Candidatus Saccharibacteria bacterium]
MNARFVEWTSMVAEGLKLVFAALILLPLVFFSLDAVYQTTLLANHYWVGDYSLVVVLIERIAIDIVMTVICGAAIAVVAATEASR